MVSSSMFADFESFFSLTPDRTPKIKEVTAPRHFSRRGKNVVFSKRVKVLEIPSARYLSRKEKQARWHAEPCEENSSGGAKGSVMRQLLCVVPGMVDHRDDSNEQEDEDVDDQGFYNPEERKQLPVTAVLMEQKSQRESGIEDENFIAKIYRQCSAHSTMKAQIRAMQDEQEARDYYNISKDSKGRRKSKNLFSRILVR
jgi:hypothetical protein